MIAAISKVACLIHLHQLTKSAEGLIVKFNNIHIFIIYKRHISTHGIIKH
jgi:hypothetical protein